MSTHYINVINVLRKIIILILSKLIPTIEGSLEEQRAHGGGQ